MRSELREEAEMQEMIARLENRDLSRKEQLMLAKLKDTCKTCIAMRENIEMSELMIELAEELDFIE